MVNSDKIIDNYAYQKQYIIPKGTFDLLRNRAAGPGRLLTIKMVKDILGLPEDSSSLIIPDSEDWAEDFDCTKNCLKLHRVNDAKNGEKKYPKEWNEELYLRTEDKRPASEFAHYSINLFKEMIKYPYNPQGPDLDAPISYTFYLAYSQKNKPDVIFSARFPIKGTFSLYVDLYYGRSIIPKSPDSDNVNTVFEDPDREECETIAASHSIRPEVFQQCLIDFWGDVPVPEPFLISWTVMYSLLTHESNKGMQLRLLWDDADNNNEMDLGFEPDPFPNSSLSFKVTPRKTSYTFKLLFGINYLNNTFQLRMYKGQNKDGSRTILIESIGTNGHSYYDLNGLHP